MSKQSFEVSLSQLLALELDVLSIKYGKIITFAGLLTILLSGNGMYLIGFFAFFCTSVKVSLTLAINKK